MELLQCPECGKRPILSSLEPEYQTMKYFCSVHCPIGDWKSTEELAAADWNRRVREYKEEAKIRVVSFESEQNDHGDYYARDVAKTYTEKLEAENAALREENAKLLAVAEAAKELISNYWNARENGRLAKKLQQALADLEGVKG